MKLEMKLPCPKSEAIESYEILLAVCRAEDAYLAVGYKQMRDLLERICRAQMQNESLQMTDLSARISFVAAKGRSFCCRAEPAAYFPAHFECYLEPPAGAQPGTTLARCENVSFLYS